MIEHHRPIRPLQTGIPQRPGIRGAVKVLSLAAAAALLLDLAIAYVFVICGPFPESAWPK